MSMPFANSPLPSARNSILPSAPVDFDHWFMTNTSLTAVTAMVSTPFALNWAALFKKLGRCRLLQVGVNAPGTPNSATFLPLKISSVVFGFGPSAVITRNVAFGNFSPALIGMSAPPHALASFLRRRFIRLRPKLVEAGSDLERARALNNREGEIGGLLRIGARRQPVELEGEGAASGGCVLDGLRDRQRPVLRRPFGKDRDRRIRRRREIDDHLVGARALDVQ